MSVHFDFRLFCDLREDTPQQVRDTLRYMTRDTEYAFDEPPDHPFFASDEIGDGQVYEGWRHIVQCREGYTPGRFGSSYQEAYRGNLPGGQQIIVPTLDFHCYVLDDSLGEYYQLCEWLAQYSRTRGFVGYFRDEDTDSLGLLYFRDGKADIVEVDHTM